MRTVTNSSGPSHFYAAFNGTSLTGKAWACRSPVPQARARDAGRIELVPRGVLMAPTKSGDRQITPDPELLLLVSRWRARAQEILAQAETMRDAEARQTMREIAARYEKLALRVEQRTRRADEV